jgi:glycosyltransferase involved in cell wall biosynthesis
MRILMLGWEFPPFITGGLGTACYGLTRALDRRGVEVTFVLPQTVRDGAAEHVTLVAPGGTAPQVIHRLREMDPGSAAARAAGAPAQSPPSPPPLPSAAIAPVPDPGAAPSPYQHMRMIHLPIEVDSAYSAPAGRDRETSELASPLDRTSKPAAPSAREARSQAAEAQLERRLVEQVLPEAPTPTVEAPPPMQPISAADYSGDLFSQAQQYARFCLQVARAERFDVIHAHDWLTYPAGLAVARLMHRPLIVHVHSTEFDRSGEHVNQRVYDIERRGMHGASVVVAVSQLTKNVCVNRYGVRAEKVQVVYNGVELGPTQPTSVGIETNEKIVLYFGRITYQKGPEYFIHAAKRVIDYMDDVKFVVAGSGDQAARMIEMAAALGIGHKVLFTGFLRGADIARVFALADVYVMPSVSEPFGIAPLEAMSHDIPVIISKTSGVSEVLTHALKVDFWDVDDIANKIIAVLRHPPLSRTLREHGAFEVRRLTWDGAAHRMEQIYHAAGRTR